MTLFSSVDAFWVGTRIGRAGLAAVSTSLFWIWMIISLAEMVGVGLTAVAARRYGEGRARRGGAPRRRRARLRLALGIVVAVVGSSRLPRLFALMDTPPDVTALGDAYLGTYLLGTPLIYGFFAVDAAFRASGDTRTPFVLLLASVADHARARPGADARRRTVPAPGHRRRGDRDDRDARRGVRDGRRRSRARRGLLRFGRVRIDVDLRRCVASDCRRPSRA